MQGENQLANSVPSSHLATASPQRHLQQIQQYHRSQHPRPMATIPSLTLRPHPERKDQYLAQSDSSGTDGSSTSNGSGSSSGSDNSKGVTTALEDRPAEPPQVQVDLSNTTLAGDATATAASASVIIDLSSEDTSVDKLPLVSSSSKLSLAVSSRSHSPSPVSTPSFRMSNSTSARVSRSHEEHFSGIKLSKEVQRTVASVTESVRRKPLEGSPSELIEEEIDKFVERVVDILARHVSTHTLNPNLPKATSGSGGNGPNYHSEESLRHFVDKAPSLGRINLTPKNSPTKIQGHLVRPEYAKACFHFVMKRTAHTLSSAVSNIRDATLVLTENGMNQYVDELAGDNDMEKCASCGNFLNWRIPKSAGMPALHSIQIQEERGSHSNSNAVHTRAPSPSPSPPLITIYRDFSDTTKSYLEFVNLLRQLHRRGVDAATTDKAVSRIAAPGWPKDLVYTTVTLWHVAPHYQWLKALMARDSLELATSRVTGRITRIHKSLMQNPPQAPFSHGYSKAEIEALLAQAGRPIRSNPLVQAVVKTHQELQPVLTASSCFEIKHITNKRHPCYGHYGLFATRQLGYEKGDLPILFDTPRAKYTRLGLHLMDYTGVVRIMTLTEMERELKSDYAYELFEFRRRANLAPGGKLYAIIDSEYVGNESRFINHYKGVADAPNVTFAFYRDTFSSELRVGIFLLRPINAGEEILIDYGEKSDGLLLHRNSQEYLTIDSDSDSESSSDTESLSSTSSDSSSDSDSDSDSEYSSIEDESEASEDSRYILSLAHTKKSSSSEAAVVTSVDLSDDGRLEADLESDLEVVINVPGSEGRRKKRRRDKDRKKHKHNKDHVTGGSTSSTTRSSSPEVDIIAVRSSIGPSEASAAPDTAHRVPVADHPSRRQSARDEDEQEHEAEKEVDVVGDAEEDEEFGLGHMYEMLSNLVSGVDDEEVEWNRLRGRALMQSERPHPDTESTSPPNSHFKRVRLDEK